MITFFTPKLCGILFFFCTLCIVNGQDVEKVTVDESSTKGKVTADELSAKGEVSFDLLVPLGNTKTIVRNFGSEEKEDNKDSVENYIQELITFIFIVLAFMSAIFIVVIGFLMVLNNVQGKVVDFQNYKKRFYDVLLGVSLLLFSFIIINTINPAIFG